MADNWNEQELQTLFRKHLPIKQMSPDFADQLKKQILAEVAATLGPNPVASVATEETNTELVAPVRERAVAVKAPRSVAAPTTYSWMDWLRERLRLTPSLTMVGGLALAIWAAVLWGDVLWEKAGLVVQQVQTSSGGNGNSAEVLPESQVQNTPVIAGAIITATETTASAVALAPTSTSEEEAPDLIAVATPQPSAVQTNEDDVEFPDAVATAITVATAANATSGWNEDVTLAPPSLTDTATPGATQPVANATPNNTNGVIASPTPIKTATSTGLFVLVPTPTAGGLPTAIGTRPTAVVTTPTNLANPERNGTVTPTAVGTRRPVGTSSATPLTLTLVEMATIAATRGIGNNGPNPTLTPFEPTSTPVPSVLIPTPTPVTTRSLFPWKSPTPRPTNTDIPLPTETDTPVPTVTRLFVATNTPVEPTLTDSPLPTVLVPNPPVSQPTNTVVPPTVAPTNPPLLIATKTATPVAPAPTNTPWPTSTSVPTVPPVLPTATATLMPTWTNTAVPPTATATLMPTWTNTAVPPTATPLPTFTDTPVPPTATPLPTFTDTPVPPTATPTAVNAQPVIISIPLPSVFDRSEYVYLVAAVDVDNPFTELQFSVIEPSWLHFDPPAANLAKLSGTPPGPGEYNVKIQVSDGASTPATQEFKLLVIPSPLDDLLPTDILPGGQGDATQNPSADVQASNSVTETQPLSSTTPSN